MQYVRGAHFCKNYISLSWFTYLEQFCKDFKKVIFFQDSLMPIAPCCIAQALPGLLALHILLSTSSLCGIQLLSMIVLRVY